MLIHLFFFVIFANFYKLLQSTFLNLKMTSPLFILDEFENENMVIMINWLWSMMY